MHRPIGLSAAIGVQTPEINYIIETSGQYSAATTNPNTNPYPKPITLSITLLNLLILALNPYLFCTNNALFAT